MRDGFREIVSGWTLIDDVEVLGEYIERAAEWTKANGPLEPDEQATVKFMIEAQIARGIRRGDFEPYISGDTDPRFLEGRKGPRPMTDLHAFVTKVSEIAEVFFKPDDQMFAHIYAEAPDGKTTMFTCPMADANEERMFRLGIPAKLRRERFRRWCFFCEAWTAEYDAGRHVILPEHRADRMEIVTFAADDGATGEKLMASRQIFRAPGQPAKLLPLVFRHMTAAFVMAEGR